jgi:MYXO-CTERM domain-containing protein
MVSLPALASAQLWEDATGATIGTTAEWSNKVEVADLNGDGRVDILFANGGGYSQAGDPEPNRIFLNQGAGQPFLEATTQILGSTADIARVIKARDVNGDGNVDIIVGTTYETQSRLYFGDGSGGYTEVTSTNLPADNASIGDLEVGDIDGDGDLDIALADWGPGDPFTSTGGRILLWVNNGAGVFTDASNQMPDTTVQWSWDMELLDTDNDYDLDIVASCKVCTGSHLFTNDGSGTYRDDRARMPQFTNNYEFEPIDINGDGFFDLVTINDGAELSGQFDRREHVFMADGEGGFVDGGTSVWPDAANIGKDDNAVVVLDFDSDGDPDFLIAALGAASDRLLINDGGRLTLDETILDSNDTSGTLGIALADFNGDNKLDLVQSQGELASDDRVYLGAGIAADTAAPVVQMVSAEGSSDGLLVRARVHDNKTPVMPHDFSKVVAELVTAEGSSRVDLQWYGGSLWRLDVDPTDVQGVRVCASDSAGNENCSTEIPVQNDGTCDRCDGGTSEPDPEPGDGGCGCSTSGGHAGWIAGGLVIVLAIRRRRKSKFFGLFS